MTGTYLFNRKLNFIYSDGKRAKDRVTGEGPDLFEVRAIAHLVDGDMSVELLSPARIYSESPGTAPGSLHEKPASNHLSYARARNNRFINGHNGMRGKQICKERKENTSVYISLEDTFLSCVMSLLASVRPNENRHVC